MKLIGAGQVPKRCHTYPDKVTRVRSRGAPPRAIGLGRCHRGFIDSLACARFAAAAAPHPWPAYSCAPSPRGRPSIMARSRGMALALLLTAHGQHVIVAATSIGRGPVNNTNLPDPLPNATYSHTFRHFVNKTVGAVQCQADCDADGPRCAGWTYVTGSQASEGLERCCLHSTLGCPQAESGVISGARVPSAACARPPPSPQLPGGMRTLLFLDDHPLNLIQNVDRRVGVPELVAAYIDPHPDLCVNWGYPSVYRCTPPESLATATWCMMYEAQTFPKHEVFMLLAQSDDGITWLPRDTTKELPALTGRKYSNQVMPVNNGSKNPEFGSVVMGHDGKLRVFGEFSIWISDDGVHWTDTQQPWQPHPTDCETSQPLQ
jgi:hypothetical protein